MKYYLWRIDTLTKIKRLINYSFDLSRVQKSLCITKDVHVEFSNPDEEFMIIYSISYPTTYYYCIDIDGRSLPHKDYIVDDH